MQPSTRKCNACFCAWGDELRASKGPWALQHPEIKGSQLNRIAATAQRDLRKELEWESARVTHERARRDTAKDLLHVDFRVHVLIDVLAASKLTTLDKSMDILRGILGREQESRASASG